jgi:solute carrier family 25 carnitine/acylcarnitine transporter 20/29
MAADFWAGYISGAIGILIGNPLDLIKVRLQAGTLTSLKPTSPSPTLSPLPSTVTSSLLPQTISPSLATSQPQHTSSTRSLFPNFSTLLRGSAAPILGYGALNALLFMTYNRSASLLTYGTLNPPISTSPPSSTSNQGHEQIQPSLTTIFIAGALGGLATWVVSTPTELVKCRAQVHSSTNSTIARSTNTSASINSYNIAKTILHSHGLKGLYAGGVVTALRDSIGYGFYFWFYEASTRHVSSRFDNSSTSDGRPPETASTEELSKVLICGGLAGVATWASIFPLDVIKTRVQTQSDLFSVPSTNTETSALLRGAPSTNTSTSKPLGAAAIARQAYRAEGARVFFRGLGVCSIRAFIVNAVQWAVYEGVMNELVPGRKKN